MTYFKKGDDKQFRIVNVAEPRIGRFQDFPADRVEYRDGCVVEVLKNDGTTCVEYDHARQRVIVSISYEKKCLYIPEFVPTARLWVRMKGNKAMHYKVPSRVEKQQGPTYILIPADPTNVELVGDQYFDAVYELQQA